ncbi:MAG: cysteine hydrolase [Anaerolineales bacterium]|jgi:nicotinamidase-related amidase
MTDKNLSPFALLLVDIQKDFWPEKLATLYPDFPENVSNLLSLCRDKGIDIVHLRAKFKKDMSDWMPRYRIRKSIPCVEGTEGREVLPFAVEKPGEKVFTKQTFDGFHNPSLIDYLQKQQIRYLLIAGLVTSTCVLFTASSATQLGFLSAVISDCCADEPTMHSTILERYRFIFDTVRSDEIIECVPRWNATLQDLAML